VSILYGDTLGRSVRQRTFDLGLVNNRYDDSRRHQPILVCALAHRAGVPHEPSIGAGGAPVTPASSATTCLMRYENQKLEGLTFDLDDDEIVGCHLVELPHSFGGKTTADILG
jgi:hypothetical protein